MSPMEAALHAARAAFADGGAPGPAPFTGPRGSSMHTGALPQAIGGRTDHIPITVPSGAYVLPADVVSALGEHNSTMGFKILDKMMGQAPYGTSMPQQARGGPGIPRRADGGPADGEAPGVDIIAAGGEYVVHPDAVARMGGGDMKAGHDLLDEFVKHTRSESIKTLRSLPGPKKD